MTATADAEPTPAQRKALRSDAFEYGATAIGTSTLLAEAFTFQDRNAQLHWKDPILFDAPIRDALHTHDPNVRDGLETMSWVLFGAQYLYPIVVDIPYVASRYGWDLARDLFWEDAVTLTLAAALDLGLRDIVGRARPNVYDCLESGRPDCLKSPESTRSFPGGHIINSTAASVLTCTQHGYLRLYGNKADAIVCIATVTSDLVIATTRIITDSHWATDQIAGLAIGTALGFGVPWLLHYHPPSNVFGNAMVFPIPLAMEHGGGVGVTGIF